MALTVVAFRQLDARATTYARTIEGERTWLVLAPVGLAALVLMLGVYIPGPLARVLSDAAAT